MSSSTSLASTTTTEQVEVTQNRGKLLDPITGELLPLNEGWARQPSYWEYSREDALCALEHSRALSSGVYHRYFRTLKEWDYYCLISQEQRFGICLTLADLGGVASLASIVFLDLKTGFKSQADSVILPWMPLSKRRASIGLASESFRGNVGVHDSTLQLAVDWETLPGFGIVSFASQSIGNAQGETGLVGRIVLKRYEEESLTIATSWGPSLRSYYYFNQKANCIQVSSGGFSIGKSQYLLNPRQDLAVLDWGRGVWTYKNRWFWSSLSCRLGDGMRFGWNLGYGFSDRSRATENCVLYEGRVHKLGEVRFVFDESDYTKPWILESSDDGDDDGQKRLMMKMVPIIDRNFTLNLGVVKSIQHQVFGRFSGYCVLDNGVRIEIKEVIGFAEDVLNWW